MLGLDPATWSRLSPLLDAALALPPERRASWLEQLPPEHADLHDRLARLLDPAARALRDAPTLDGDDEELPCRRVGDRIGPWLLIEPLGRGGMGEVWLAERTDGRLQRRVALKLPHADRLHAGLAARLARERDILAALEHPAIARLYDAGIDAGQPWLALEAVRGQRIDQWCSAREATVAQRLQLFVQAAQAVAYAHAQLVVHRDLKPSNLLVDEAGQVHLLDFGIAKLLDDGPAPSPELTQRGAAVMTPAYASPEQVAGLPVGTASDLYSLGVLLFELLAGTSPYRPQRSTRTALEEAVLSEIPRRPSDACTEPARRRALRGDLDAIVLQALAKDPRQRYPTVDALVEDLRRHGRHEPVRARRAGMAYATAKFMRRHRAGVLAGGAVAAALVLGVALAWWQAGRAEHERERAEQVKGFLTSLLRDASPYSAGDTTRLTAVDLMRQAWERLQQTPIAQPEVRVELGTLIGESLTTLGDLDRAEPALAQAASQARAELGDAHPLTLAARLNHAQVLRLRGRVAEQHRELQALLPLLREAGRKDPVISVQGLQHVALNAVDRGAYAEAEVAAAEGFALARQALGERHADTVACAILQALTHRYAGHFDAALRQGELALTLAEGLYAGPAVHPRVLEARAVYGRALADTGRLEAGIAQLQRTLEETARLFGAEAPSVGMLHQNLVVYQIDAGDLDRAEHNARIALDIVRRTAEAGSYPEAVTAMSHAMALLEQRRFAEAAPMLAAATPRLQRLLGPANEHAQRANLLWVRAEIGLGRWDQAAARLASIPPSSQPRTEAIRARAAAALAIARGDLDAAHAQLQALWTSTAPDPRLQRERAMARAEMGLALRAAGRTAEARPLLLAAQRDLAALQSVQTPLARDVAHALEPPG